MAAILCDSFQIILILLKINLAAWIYLLEDSCSIYILTLTFPTYPQVLSKNNLALD